MVNNTLHERLIVHHQYKNVSGVPQNFHKFHKFHKFGSIHEKKACSSPAYRLFGTWVISSIGRTKSSFCVIACVASYNVSLQIHEEEAAEIDG